MQGWSQVDPKAELDMSRSPYSAMGNNPIFHTDPNGDVLPAIAIAAIIGGAVGGIGNTAAHWKQITAGGGFSFGAFAKAFGTGAAGGAIAGATGFGAVGAGLWSGAAIGAGSGIAGDLVTQVGNMAFFGDQFSAGQLAFAGGLGGVAGGLTGHFTKPGSSAVPKGSTAEVFDEFIDPYATHSVASKGGHHLVDDALNSQKVLLDEYVVTASRNTPFKDFLKNAGQYSRGDLISKIRSYGFDEVGEFNGIHKFQRGKWNIRLDPPQAQTNFHHMHVLYGKDKTGQYFNNFLNRVSRTSPAAHIRIKPN